MDIGRLKHRITFQKLVNSKNEYGELENSWNDVITVWAEVRPTTGRSFFNAKQINSEISHSVYIRYRNGLSPNMRIKFKGRIFEVLYIMNVNEDNTLMQIYCKELVN